MRTLPVRIVEKISTDFLGINSWFGNFEIIKNIFNSPFGILEKMICLNIFQYYFTESFITEFIRSEGIFFLFVMSFSILFVYLKEEKNQFLIFLLLFRFLTLFLLWKFLRFHKNVILTPWMFFTDFFSQFSIFVIRSIILKKKITASV